jgi:DNA-binding MarR family transcriptional regulator
MSQPRETGSMEYLLGQICKLHHARAHALLETLGLYRGQPRLLGALYQDEGPTHGELADRLRVTPATITKMIQRMEKAGFVERHADPADQRVSRVYLTEAGHAVRAAMDRALGTLEGESLAGLTEAERLQLYALLLRVRDNLAYAVEACAPAWTIDEKELHLT